MSLVVSSEQLKTYFISLPRMGQSLTHLRSLLVGEAYSVAVYLCVVVILVANDLYIYLYIHSNILKP